MKFLTDSALGRLAKWLRILGYDTVFHRGNLDGSALRKAEREDRTVLTRKKALEKRQYAGKILILSEDRADEQVGEVIEKLSLAPTQEEFFTRCIICNEKLLPLDKKDAASDVPAHVLETCTTFRKCPSCRKVYWPGTHKENMREFMLSRNLFRLP